MPLRNIPNSISNLNEKLRNKGSKLPDHVFMNLLGSTEYQDKLKMTTIDDLDITDEEIDLAIQEAGGQGYKAEVMEDITDASKKGKTSPQDKSSYVDPNENPISKTLNEQNVTPAGMVTDSTVDASEEIKIDVQPQQEIKVDEPTTLSLEAESAIDFTPTPEFYQQLEASILQEYTDELNRSMVQEGGTTIIQTSTPIFQNITEANTIFLQGSTYYRSGEYDRQPYHTVTSNQNLEEIYFKPDGEIEGLPYVTTDDGLNRLTSGGAATNHIAISIDPFMPGDRAMMEVASFMSGDSRLELISTDELENAKKEFVDSQDENSDYMKEFGNMSALEELKYHVEEYQRITSNRKLSAAKEGRDYLESVMNNSWIKGSTGMLLYEEIKPGTTTTIASENINPILRASLEQQGIISDLGEGRHSIIQFDDYVSSLNLEATFEGWTPFGLPYNRPGLAYDNINLATYESDIKENLASVYTSIRYGIASDTEGSYGIEFLNNKDERVGELEHVLKNNGYVLVNQENLEQLKNSENFVAQKAYEFISKNYDLDSKKLKDRDGFELLYLSPMLFENPDMQYSRAKEMESQYGIEITAANRHLSQVSSYSAVSYGDATNTSLELLHITQTDLDYQADLMTDAIVRFAETGELSFPSDFDKDFYIPSGDTKALEPQFRINRQTGAYEQYTPLQNINKMVSAYDAVMYHLQQINPGAEKPALTDVEDLIKILNQSMQLVSLHDTDENGNVKVYERRRIEDNQVIYANFDPEQNKQFWAQGWLPVNGSEFRASWANNAKEEMDIKYDPSEDDGTEDGYTYYEQLFLKTEPTLALHDYSGGWFFPGNDLLGIKFGEEDPDDLFTNVMIDARLKFMNYEEPFDPVAIKTGYDVVEGRTGISTVTRTDRVSPTFTQSIGFPEEAYFSPLRVNSVDWNGLSMPFAYRVKSQEEIAAWEKENGRPMPDKNKAGLRPGYNMFMFEEGNGFKLLDGRNMAVGNTAEMMDYYNTLKSMYPNSSEFAKQWYRSFYDEDGNPGFSVLPSSFVKYEDYSQRSKDAMLGWYINNGYMNGANYAPDKKYKLLAEFQPVYLGKMLTQMESTSLDSKKLPIQMELELKEAELEAGLLADLMNTLDDPKLVEERMLARDGFISVYNRIVDLQTFDEPEYKRFFKNQLEQACRVKAAGSGSCYIVRMDNGVEQAMNDEEFLIWKKSKNYNYNDADVRTFELEGWEQYGLVRWGAARASNLVNGFLSLGLQTGYNLTGDKSMLNSIEELNESQKQINNTVWGQKWRGSVKGEYVEFDHKGTPLRAYVEGDQIAYFKTVDGAMVQDFDGSMKNSYSMSDGVRVSDFSGRSLIAQTADVGGDLAILIALTYVSGGATAALGGGAQGAMISSRMAAFLTTMSQTYNGQVTASLQGGASIEDAVSYGFWSSMGISSINLFAPGLEKTVLGKLDDAVAGKTISESTEKAILSSLNKYKTSLSFDDFMAFAKEWGKAGLNESIQEVILEGISDEAFQDLVLPQSVDKEMYKTFDEAVTEGIISFLVSGPVSVSAFNQNSFEQGALMMLAVNPESSIADAKKLKDNGKITEEQLSTFSDQVRIAHNSLKKIRALNMNDKIDGVFNSVFEYEKALYENENAPEGETVFSEDQLKDLENKYREDAKNTKGYVDVIRQDDDIITDDQLLDFYMNGVVPREIVTHISTKLYRDQNLTARENYIYNLVKPDMDKVVGRYVLHERLNDPIVSKTENEPLAPVSEDQQKKLTSYYDVLMGARKASEDPENASDQDKEYAQLVEDAGIDVTNPEYSMTLTGVEFESLFDNDAIELDMERPLMSDLDTDQPTDMIQGGDYVVVFKNTLKFDPAFENGVNVSGSNTNAKLGGTIRVDDVQAVYKREGQTLTLVYEGSGFVANDGLVQNPVSGSDIQKNTDQTSTDISKELGVEIEVLEDPTKGDLTIDPGTQSDVFVLDMTTADLQQAINNGRIPDNAVFRMFNGKVAKGTRYIVVGKGTPQFVPFDEGQDQAGYFESSGNARGKVSSMSYYDIYRVNEDGSVSKVDYDAIRAKATETITSDKIVEGLNESGMENVTELEDLINNGQWGAFTAENPDKKQLSNQENQELNEKAKAWLKGRGYETVIDIQGQYGGNPEHSFLVPGMSRQDAIDFAEEFGQESVATNEGLIYRDGTVETRVDSPVETRAYGSFDDNYSTIKIGGRNVSFAANYQFGVKQNLGEWNGERVDPSEVFVPEDAKQNSPSSVDIMTGVGTFADSPITTMPGSAVVKTPEGTRIVMRDLDEGVSELMSIYTPRSKRGQGNAASAVQGIVEGAEGSGNIIMTRLAGKDSYLEGMLLDNGFVKEGDVYVYTPSTYVAPVASRPDSRSNLKVTGNEEVVESSGTVGTAVKGNGTTLKTTDGAYFSSNEAYRQGASSAVVTEAIKLMSGEFTYTNPKGEVFTVKLPIVDKKLQTKIKSLRTRYKNATSKAQKDRLKLKLQEATEQAYNQVVEHAEAMLQANLDIASPEFIEQGRQWYDGANRLAQGLASEYGISLEKSAAMIAALSPQNPWDNNLANAESLLSVLTLGSDIAIDADVIAQIESLRNNDKGNPRADVVSVLDAIENFEGKTIAQLNAEGIDPRILGIVARAIFQAEMQAEASEAGVSLSEYLRYPQYRADGSFFEMSNSRESLGSFGELGKAIEIFFLTDESKITSMLGNGNKVRNFYNNIVNPNSAEGYVTIDTHATAIALGVPMGSNAVGGLGVFKGGPSYTYSAIAEAYRNVAARNGMLPRELQSVVWTMAQSGIHADNNKYENYRERVTEIFSGEGTIADKAREFVEGVEFVEPRWLDGTGVSLTTLPKVRPTNESDANQATRGESDSGVEGDVGIGESSPTDVVVQPTEQVKPTENDTKNKIQPGTNLYGQSVPAVENIKNQYHKQQFGESAPEYTGEQTLNESEQRDLGQAYDEMENAYDDPEVVAAYELWAKETLAQYEAMIAAGYEIVIDHNEPYANAQELVEDVRNNRRLKIFSTESGFGDGITDEMRAKDVRLRPSGFFDKNGKPLLINDVFRGVHDFFGHAVLGNNFSALGEEVAFQVHSRMYSEGAIGPLVSEARAQNAWINFHSEQTQEFYELEAEQKRLEAEGRLDEARLLDPLIQQAVTYPPQKFNVLPKRFWNVDRSNTGAFERTGRVQQQAVEQQDVNFKFKWTSLGLGKFDGDPRTLGTPQSIPGNSPQVSARAMDVLVDRLMESGLATNVTTDKASWEKAINDHFSKKERGRMAKLPDGTIYGFINNSGEVFLNPEVVRASTPIHEFGHLWAIALKNSDPEAYQAALDVMKNTPYHKAVKADPLYSDLAETDPNSTEILEEALANAIADHGEQLIKEGAKQEFGEIEEDISEAVYERLEDVFGSPQFEMLLGTQLASLDSSPSAETVAKKAAAEILGGKQETKNQEVPKSPEEQVETPPPAQPPVEPTEEPSEEGPEATYRTLERALAKAEQEGNEELAEEYRKAVNEGRPIVATEKVVEMRDKAMDQLKKSPDFDGSVERILFEINQTTQQELIDNPHLSSYQAALLDAIASYYEDMGKTKKAVEVRTAQARISSNAGRTLQAFGNTQVTNLPTLDKMKSDNKANKKAYGQKMDGNEDAVNEAMAEAAPTQAEVQNAANSDNVNKAVEQAYKKARKATDRSRRTNEQRYNSAIKSAKKNAAKVDGDPTQSDKFMGNVRSAVQAAFNMEAESKSGNLQQNLDNIAEQLNIPNSVVNEIANETAKQKVARGASLPEVKAAINDIIYNHYFDRQGDSRSIADKIVDAIPGISTAEANAIANALTQQIVEAIEKRVRKAHERMLDIAGTTKKKKPLNVSDGKKYGKLILALAQGGFSTQTVVDNSDIAPALAEYFGIEVLNDNEIAKLETMIYEYMNLDEGERKQRRLRDINNYIQNVKTSSMAHILSGLITDIMYANALSGFSTMERATLGGLQTSLMQVVFDAIAGGMNAGMDMTVGREGSMAGVVAGGVADQARGLLDALVSLIPNLHELALQRKFGGFISTMLDGYSPLEFADGRDPGVESLLDNIINNNPDFKNADSKVKEAIKLAIKVHMFPAVYASRFLPAIDGVLRDQIMSYAERQQVRDYLVERGYNTFSIDMYKKLNEIRGKRDMEEIYERVDEEIDEMIENGEKVPFGYRDRRAEEMRKQRTQERLENDDLIEQQKDFAASSLLMGSPEGRLGQAYDFATQNLTLRESDSILARATKIGLRTIFLFLKVPTNFINMTLDYTPYGIYRGLRGDTRVKGGDRRMYTETERARRVLQGGAGLMAGLAFLARAFDYDDEGNLIPNPDFEVFGEKPDRLRWSDKRNLGRKYSEMSIKVGDQYYSFVDNPLGIWLAPIAYMQDDLRADKDTEYDPVGVMMYYSQGMGKFGFSQSYSQGINDLIRIVEAVGDPEAMAEIAQKRGESTFDLLTVSNLRRQTVKIWNDIQENPERTDLNFIQKRLGNYPMLMAVTAPEKVDQFGNPVDVDFETGYFLGEFVDAIDEYMTVVETKEYREWALLEKFPDVFVGYRNTTMWKEEELDQEQESFLRRETAFAFGDLVRENIDRLEQIEESEDLDRELKELFSEAKEIADANFYEAYPEFTYEALVNYEGWDPFGGIDFDEAQQYYSVLKSFDGGMERFRERYYEPVTMRGYEFTVAESETIKGYASIHFGENILQAKDMLENPNVSIGAKNDIIDKYWGLGIKQAKADWVSENPEKFSEGVEEAAQEKAETYQEYQNRMRNRNK